MDLIQDLLESEDPSIRLIGTLSLYGTIYYKMDLQNGSIRWRGVAEKLFNERMVYTFDHLMHLIRPQHGFNRLQKIFNGHDQFECVWDSLLHNKYWVHIYESGKLKKEADNKFFLYGGLSIHPSCTLLNEEDELFKLTDFMTQDMETKSIKSLVLCSIDNTARICTQHGIEFLTTTIDKFGQELSKIDNIVCMVKLSDNTYALILDNVTADNFGHIKLNVTQALSNSHPKDIGLKSTSFCGMYPLASLSATDLINAGQDVLSTLKTDQNTFHYWRPSMVALTPDQGQIKIG